MLLFCVFDRMFYRTGTLYGISISLIIINLATMMQRFDEKLINSTAKELKEAFHANLSDIGLLSFIRTIVQGVASPLAGLLAISYDRPAVFAFGSFFWVSSSAATGVSRYFSLVLFHLLIFFDDHNLSNTI